MSPTFSANVDAVNFESSERSYESFNKTIAWAISTRQLIRLCTSTPTATRVRNARAIFNVCL